MLMGATHNAVRRSMREYHYFHNAEVASLHLFHRRRRLLSGVYGLMSSLARIVTKGHCASSIAASAVGGYIGNVPDK